MEGKDLSANTFELEMDGGLIPQKGRGSLTKLPWLKGGTRLLIWVVGSKSNGSDAFRSDGPIRIGLVRSGWARGTAGPHGGARRRRRRDFGCGLRFMIASVRGRGGRADAHRGLELAGETAQDGRRRGPSGGDGGARGECCCRGVRGPLDVRIGRGTPCRGNQGVKTDQDATTTRNSDGGAAHRQRFLWEIWSMPRRRASMLGSWSFGMAKRSFCD
jgi:hypothetical protein